MIILSVFTLVNALFSITPFEHAHQFVFTLIHISQIHKANIGAVCVESRPHPDFLGPRWWEDMALIIQELKKYNMKLWILDDCHFPTGYAGGAVRDKPRYGKRVLAHRRVEVLGPRLQAGVFTKIPGDETAVVRAVVARQGERVLDLSPGKWDKILYFDVPEGLWQVFLIYESRKVSYNPDYINMVDPDSCRLLIDAVYEAHYSHFKDEFGKTIAGFFSDEPGFGNEKGVKNDSSIGKDMPLPWSPLLEQRLNDRLGSDFWCKLPALWMELPDSPHVRYGYMDECSRLYSQCFSAEIGGWCQRHGVEYIGHIIEDRDSHARLGVGAGHFFRAMYGQDMAGVDVVLNQIIPGMDESFHPTFRGGWDSEFFHYGLVKLGSSLAHIDPKKHGRAVGEVFGAYGWSQGTSMMKWIIDHFLARGVNYFVPHAFSMGEFPDPDCPPHFYARGENPQFPFFGILMDYTNKMCSIFSGGRTLTDAAVLYHGESEWAGDYMPFHKVTKELTRNQIDFDIIPSDVFCGNEYFSCQCNGKTLTVNTQEYKVLVIPYSQYIGKELYGFIETHEEFPVIFLEEFPLGLYDSDQELSLSSLRHVHCVRREELAGWLRSGQYASVETEAFCPYLRLHRYEKDGMVYMMAFNEDPLHPLHTRVRVPETGPVLCQNLMSDSLTQAKVSDSMIRIDLHPYESCVYLLGAANAENVPEPVGYDRLLETITGPAALSLYDPEKKDFVSAGMLKRFGNLSGAGHYPDYSGTFAYELSFTLDKEERAVEIDLGQVYDTAVVWLDGRKLGTRICPPFLFYETSVSKGTHVLRIEAANTLDKRHMDVISAAQEIQPSGVLGPVRIRGPRM